jgi:hypothetical protein
LAEKVGLKAAKLFRARTTKDMGNDPPALKTPPAGSTRMKTPAWLSNLSAAEVPEEAAFERSRRGVIRPSITGASHWKSTAAVLLLRRVKGV